VFDPASATQQRFTGLGPAPIPDPRDGEIETFVRGLVAGGPAAVTATTQSSTPQARQVLCAYAERMASTAVRDGGAAPLELGLVALVAGGLADGERDALMVMAPIDDAASRVGIDTADLFERVAKVVGHPGTVSLMVWLTRKPEDRALASMGYVVSSDDGGFRYRLDW
jgi:hypothetical protein